jgi:hypothetical protein
MKSHLFVKLVLLQIESGVWKVPVNESYLLGLVYPLQDVVLQSVEKFNDLLWSRTMQRAQSLLQKRQVGHRLRHCDSTKHMRRMHFSTMHFSKARAVCRNLFATHVQK